MPYSALGWIVSQRLFSYPLQNRHYRIIKYNKNIHSFGIKKKKLGKEGELSRRE
jgi:hypothetical protein